jgi:uncharacterized membrane protein
MATSKGQSKRPSASGGTARGTNGYGRSGARTNAAVSATPTSRQAAGRPAKAVPRPAEPVADVEAFEPEVPARPDRPAGVPPLWLQVVSFVLAIGGLAISSYEAWAHYNGSHLAACGGNGSENCTAVITSAQSMVFGVIPVAILGLAFYVFAVAIFSPWGWQFPWRSRELGLIRLGSMVVGMGFVMYLIYAELYQIGSWCLYCTGVHIITFVLFCLTVLVAAIWGLPKRADS